MEKLEFKLSADGRKLQAVCNPAAEPRQPIDEGYVKRALAASGFSEYFLQNNVCSELAQRFNSASSTFTMDIGEKRDGTYTITVSPDGMTAQLTLTPPYGGKAVTNEEIHQGLKEQGVQSGILEDTIEAAATCCRALNKVIATGTPPTPGADGQLLSLIPEMKERGPQFEDDDKSIVDYREVGGIVSVKAGDPLMRRVPPAEGEPGKNVRGEVVPPTPGRDVQFAANLPGTMISPDDNDLLLAAIAGQPVLVTNGVVVEPVFKVKNVDLSSGNISFEGSVVVDGDVASGMVVKAAGDISIGGTVESAVIEAGGNIEINGGVIFSSLQAKGSITALFAEKSHFSAGSDVHLRELSMQSDLTAGGQIMVGEEGTAKGRLIGGTCRASTLVNAVVIGSHAGVPTKVEVGLDPTARAKLVTVTHQLEEKQKQTEEATKSLSYMRENPARFGEDAEKAKQQQLSHLQAEVLELTGQKKRLQKRLEVIDFARIKVQETIYYGVQVVIGDQALVVDDDLQGVTFSLDNGTIVF